MELDDMPPYFEGPAEAGEENPACHLCLTVHDDGEHADECNWFPWNGGPDGACNCGASAPCPAWEGE